MIDWQENNKISNRCRTFLVHFQNYKVKFVAALD
jgi:hypothetical protein